MKTAAVLLLISVLMVPGLQAKANSDTVNIELSTLFFIKNHCERKLRRCFSDRNTARALISEIKNAPLNRVEAICTEICTSPSEIRITRGCNDDQCDNRCDITGGLDDAFFLEMIERRRYEELQTICD